MLAITGITGQVGAAVARSLLSADRSVRAVVRSHDKGAPWAALGCEVAVAEMTDVDALAAAFTDTDGVFVLIPPIFDPEPGFPEAARYAEAVRDAALRAKPERLVVLSTIGADAGRPNLLESLARVEGILRELPMPVTFLRAAWFMENAAWDIAGAREGVIESYLQPLDRAVPMVSTDDVGRSAATLLTERWNGVRIVELEGPARVTPNDIAAAFAKALGRSVQVRAVPREEWETRFRALGMQRPEPRMQMIDGFNAGWIDFADGGAYARHGEIGIDRAIVTLLQRDG